MRNKLFPDFSSELYSTEDKKPTALKRSDTPQTVLMDKGLKDLHYLHCYYFGKSVPPLPLNDFSQLPLEGAGWIEQSSRAMLGSSAMLPACSKHTLPGQQPHAGTGSWSSGAQQQIQQSTARGSGPITGLEKHLTKERQEPGALPGYDVGWCLACMELSHIRISSQLPPQ